MRNRLREILLTKHLTHALYISSFDLNSAKNQTRWRRVTLRCSTDCHVMRDKTISASQALLLAARLRNSS
jgi:hypothetical protein